MIAKPMRGTVQRVANCSFCGKQILFVPGFGWIHHPALKKECR